MTYARAGRRPVLRRLGPLLLVVALLGTLAGSLATPVSAGDPLTDAIAKQKALRAKIEKQKKQIAQLKVQQAGLQQDIAETADALAAVNADLKLAKKRVAKVTTLVNQARVRVNTLTGQVKEWDAEVAQLEDDVAKQDRLLEIRKSLLATRIRAAYMTDRTSILETILSAQSFTDVVSDVSSYMDISAQDEALAGQIERDRQLLEVSRKMAEEARATTDELRLESKAEKVALVARLADLKKARDELRTLDAKVKKQLALQQRNFSKVRQTAAQLKAAMDREIKAENALKAKIRRLIDAQQLGGNIPSAYNGTLMWPLGGVVTQEFGCTGVGWEPPAGSCGHYHNGIDIAAPIGTPVRAAGDGVVVFAGPNPYDPYPKAVIVIIAHSTGLQTWYAHLEPSVAVQAGQRVSQGQVVGYVGMTGRTTGPHLHWMVVLNDVYSNPRLFL
jgi:murein DD-endopeptidase MepM/ murein hydrolase activator NlpD